MRDLQKYDRLLRTTQMPYYYPYCGYVIGGFNGKTLLHTGQYIQYPKNSKHQQYLKRVSAKQVRKCPYLPPKGNGYRKVFDYWWELY